MAATTVTANFLTSLVALASAVKGLGTQQEAFTLPQLINLGLISGNTGALKVDQLYQAQGTLAASASVDIDLYAFGGALDAGGNAYTNTIVKLLIFRNFGVAGATVEADYIKLGGKGTTAGWTSWLGTNTDTVKVLSGPATATNPTLTPGFLMIGDGGATGYAVGASTTNHILTLTAGANTGTVAYDIIVVGATA